MYKALDNLYRTSLSIARIAVFAIDCKTEDIVTTPVINEILGLGKFVSLNFSGFMDMIHIDMRSKYLDCFKQARRDKLKFDLEFKVIRQSDKEECWVRQTGEFLTDVETGNVSFVSIIQDISDKKIPESLIIYQEDYDRLTGLHNKKYFDEKLFEMDLETNFPMSVIIIHVNGLHRANETLGYTVGDRMLTRIASSLLSVSRYDDVLARVSGNEFAMLLPKTNLNSTELLIYNIKSSVQHEKIEGVEIALSFGLATKSKKDDPIRNVYRRAEESIYKSKMEESAKDMLLRRVNDYINDNLSAEISLSTIASELFHSSSYFSKMFKRLTGIGFCEYVERKRMERACYLLKNTGLKASDIAKAVGYDSHTYFSRIFKNVYGITPLVYRNQ